MPGRSFPPFHPFRSEEARLEYERHCADRARDWPVPVETRFLETPSGRTFVRICGDPADPPLVLLPGARVGSLMWLDVIQALSARHRTYALDIPGDVGLSVRRSDVTKPGEFVDWLEEVAEVLWPGRPFSLVGISLGGSIAAQYAARCPDRLKSMVLLAPGATVMRLSAGFFFRFALLSLPMLALGRRPLRRTCEWLFADAMRGDAACRRRVEQVIADAQMVVRLFALRPPPWPPVLSDEAWRALRVPCLVLVGENEKLYSARAALARLARVAPHVRAEVLPGAGHDLMIVYPDEVAGKTLAFLAKRD